MRWARAACVCWLGAVGCTYGPPEDRAFVPQIVRLGDSYQAVAVVERDRVRRPTGLAAFPDGGRWDFLTQEVSLVLLDVGVPRAVTITTQAAADRLWESFEARITGAEADSVLYLRMTGCPRGGECHGDLRNAAVLRVTPSGSVDPVDAVPPDAVLPGTMLARAPGEERYVRFLTSGDTIGVRSEDDGPYRPMFVLAPNGTLSPIGR